MLIKHDIDLICSDTNWSLNTLNLINRINHILNYFCHEKVTVTLALITDHEMTHYNETYRGKIGSTDVLSFTPSFSHLHNDEMRSFLGDIFLSLDFHLREKQRGETIAFSLERSIIHGLLHLKGFDHDRGNDHYHVMLSLQKTIHRETIRTLGLPQWISKRRNL